MQFGSGIMQNGKNLHRPRKVAVLLFDAFSNHCLANAVEPLRACNNLSGRTLYEWDYVSLDGRPVTSSSGLTVQTGMALAAHPGGDYLFVVSSYDFARHGTAATARGLRAARRRFGTLAGMDTGSWLIARAGLAAGRRMTIHWDEADRLAEDFPETAVEPARVLHDGDLISCGGATTTFELILDLIEAHHGPMLRLEVTTLFMHGETRRGDGLPPGRETEAGVSAMRRRIETPVPVAQIAGELGLSKRAFEARCMERYGLTPRRLYLSTRLREARRMVETTGLSVAEIATRCGYRDASAMTRAFRKEFGIAPRDLRARLRQG